MAGAAYPYWYMGNYGITFLESLRVPGWANEPNGLGKLFPDLPEIAKFLPARLERNLTAGIYLDHQEVAELLVLIDEHAADLVQKMELKQFSSDLAAIILQKLTEALTYSFNHGLGLLEATDVFEAEPLPYP